MWCFNRKIYFLIFLLTTKIHIHLSHKILKILQDQKFESASKHILQGKTELQCVFKCIQLKDCHSINHNSQQNVCEVNYGDIDEEALTESIINKAGWKYSKIMNPSVKIKVSIKIFFLERILFF